MEKSHDQMSFLILEVPIVMCGLGTGWVIRRYVILGLLVQNDGTTTPVRLR